MTLPFRMLTGFSAAFATMAFVVGSAFFQPASPAGRTASVCPSTLQADQKSKPSGA